MDYLITTAVSNSLAAAVLAIVIIVAGGRSQRPSILHGLWLIVLLKLVTPPLASIPVSWSFRSAPKAAPTTVSSSEEVHLLTLDEERTEPGASLSQRVGRANWPSVYVFVSLLGTTLYFACCFYRAHSFGRWLRYASPAPEDLVDRARRFADRMGLRRCPEILIVPGQLPPLVWSGWGIPRIYLPKQLFERLEARGCDALLVHELAHVQRCDHWVRYFEILVTGLYWWNPVVWLARRGIRETEELCCDRLVLKYCSQCGPTYARSLLKTLDFIGGEQVSLPEAASAVSPKIFLKRRIEMLLQGSLSLERRWTSRITLMVALLVVLPITLSLAAKPVEPPTIPAIERPSVAIPKHVYSITFQLREEKDGKSVPVAFPTMVLAVGRIGNAHWHDNTNATDTNRPADHVCKCRISEKTGDSVVLNVNREDIVNYTRSDDGQEMWTTKLFRFRKKIKLGQESQITLLNDGRNVSGTVKVEQLDYERLVRRK